MTALKNCQMNEDQGGDRKEAAAAAERMEQQRLLAKRQAAIQETMEKAQKEAEGMSMVILWTCGLWALSSSSF